MKKNILIVDDNADIRDLLAEFLSGAGYQTVSADSAGAALGILSNTCIDLVLVDIHMPEIDGFAFKRMVKSSETIKDIPVVFMSGYGPQVERAPSLVLIKPFKFDDLIKVIELNLQSETTP